MKISAFKVMCLPNRSDFVQFLNISQQIRTHENRKKEKKT